MGVALSWGLPGEGRAETSPLVVLRLDTQCSLPDLGRRLEKEQRPAIPGLTPYTGLNPRGRDGAEPNSPEASCGPGPAAFSRLRAGQLPARGPGRRFLLLRGWGGGPCLAASPTTPPSLTSPPPRPLPLWEPRASDIL